MAVKIKAVLQNFQSKLEAMGRFASVSIGQPTSPPNSPHAAVDLERYENAGTTLSGTIERRIVRVRIYHILPTQEPSADLEFLLDDIVAEFMEDVWGDFDLGGVVRNVEPLGTGVNFGYLQVAQTWFRIVDISLPMIVDDSATFVQ